MSTVMAGSGAGRIHTLKEPMALSELVQRIKQFLKLDHGHSYVPVHFN
jgi:putative NIF3 family GTP cyclohydrolase 1 type 2